MTAPLTPNIDASTMDALNFIERNAWWWYELPPGVRTYYRLKARIMSNRPLPYILTGLVLVAVVVLAIELKLPAGVAILFILSGILLGLLIAWAMNHNGNHK